MKAPFIWICAALPLCLASCGKTTSESSTDQARPSPATMPAPASSAPPPTSEEQPSKDEPKVSPAQTAAGATADQPPQMALARESGCLACHSVKKKVVGPAWKDVAKRYAGDATARARLVAKVKSGGKGNWTDITGGASMPPYSPRVSDANIETLVEFVLSLAD